MNTELTNIEADEDDSLIEQMTMADAVRIAEGLAQYDAEIKKFAQKRDAVIEYARELIAKANEDFADETHAAREEITYRTELLRRFAPRIIPKGKKSVNIGHVTCSFREAKPKYFIGGEQVDKDNPTLLNFAKLNAPEYVKRTEYVDWAGLKTRLKGDGDDVYFADTGEIIEGLSVQNYPDKFAVKVR